MNYYPFHIGDYLSATRHLSWEEDAAYRRLLDTYYTSEKQLPADFRAVYRLVMANTESQREAVKIVLEEFFELTDTGWRNGRADAEIAEMQARQQKQRDKANKRWHKPRTEHGITLALPRHEHIDAVASKSDANAMPPVPTPTPVPTLKKEDSGSSQATTPPPPYRGEANESEIPVKAVVVLSNDWELPEPWGVDAEKLGWPAKDILHEAEKFRQYYTVGKGGGTRRGVKGWRQAWSNWLSKASNFSPIRRVV